MNEIVWKDIQGYEGLYQVSCSGLVKSLERINNQNHRIKECFIKPTKAGKGYLKAKLCKGKDTKCFYIHRLVASAFCQKPTSANQVNHIDGNKANNFARNLEWITAKGNVQHALVKGLIPWIGAGSHYAKLTEEKVAEILTLLRKGEITATAIAKQFNVSNGCISMIANGKTWKYTGASNIES